MNLVLRSVIIIVLTSVIGISIYSLINDSRKGDYERSLIAERTQKDIWFGSDFDSPFLKTNTPFHRLHYFEPNIDFMIKVKVSKRSAVDSIELVTSSGASEWYHIYGEAIFTLLNKKNSLQLLFQPGDKELFIPFMDATSGKNSYGAGRYLEAQIPYENELVLDFNLAYNPYCAYVEGYSCPFPPKKNILEISIEAGEKSFYD